MLAPFFSLGGVVVPVLASLELEQTYAPIGGYATLRMLDGAGVRQTQWQRLRTSLTGSGPIPAGLEALDYSQPQELLCAAPRSLIVTAPTANLPVARRTDAGYLPTALALVDGKPAPTTLTIAGDVATIAAVTGAQQYVIRYWPRITVLAETPTVSFSHFRAQWQWTLEAEQQ